MRRNWFYVKNHFWNFYQIFTFWDPLSQKKRYVNQPHPIKIDIIKEIFVFLIVSDSAHKSLLNSLKHFPSEPKLGKWRYIKTWKKSISKFHFPVKLYKIRKNIIIPNCLLQKDLQIWILKFFYEMYIFLSNLTKFYWNLKIEFLNQNMWNTRKTPERKIVRFNKVYTFYSTQFLIKCIFFISISKNTIEIQEFHCFKQNIWHTNKTLKWKIICLNKVYKCSLGHFSTICIICFNFKNIIENQKFHFLT